MFDDIELTNCPSEYALNCKNYEIKCHACKANNSGKYLQYKPINKDINNHPASVKQKSRPVSYSRKGRAAEKKMINNIPYLKSTYASGSVGGDGDAYIDLYNIGRIRVEIKNRFTEGGYKYPSAKEYRESATQGVGIILIQHHVRQETYAYMTFKLFITIWRVLLFHPDIRNSDDKYQWGYVTRFYEKCGTNLQDNVGKACFFLGEEKNSPTNIFKDDMMRYSRCVVYRKPMGQYVMMHENTLTELIGLYKYVTLDS